MDIVFLNNNEKEFQEIASKLDLKLYSEGDLTILKKPVREELNRNVDIIYGMEEDKKKDFIHHRNSGLNHILAKILFEKDIAVGFSFSLFLKYGATILGRMKQNVKLCKKYKVKMFVASFTSDPYELRSEEDMKVFAKTIGMTGKENKVVEDKIIYNKKKKEGKIPADGVEILDF